MASDLPGPLVRLAGLMDADSLTPLNDRDEIAVVAACGRVDGEKVIAFCVDATRKGGALGLAESIRIAGAIDLAVIEDRPVIGLWHSGGAKIGDGIESTRIIQIATGEHGPMSPCERSLQAARRGPSRESE